MNPRAKFAIVKKGSNKDPLYEDFECIRRFDLVNCNLFFVDYNDNDFSIRLNHKKEKGSVKYTTDNIYHTFEITGGYGYDYIIKVIIAEITEKLVNQQIFQLKKHGILE